MDSGDYITHHDESGVTLGITDAGGYTAFLRREEDERNAQLMRDMMESMRAQGQNTHFGDDDKWAEEWGLSPRAAPVLPAAPSPGEIQNRQRGVIEIP